MGSQGKRRDLEVPLTSRHPVLEVVTHWGTFRAVPVPDKLTPEGSAELWALPGGEQVTALGLRVRCLREGWTGPRRVRE